MKQVAVGHRAERLGAVPVGEQEATGKDRRLMQTVFALQAVQRGESNAKAAVQVADGIKELGLQLRV